MPAEISTPIPLILLVNTIEVEDKQLRRAPFCTVRNLFVFYLILMSRQTNNPSTIVPELFLAPRNALIEVVRFQRAVHDEIDNVHVMKSAAKALNSVTRQRLISTGVSSDDRIKSSESRAVYLNYQLQNQIHKRRPV